MAIREGAVESVGVTQFGNIYRGRRVLITGHTGFKGSWLALWLSELGAEITGLALPPPTSPSHWDLLDLTIGEHRLDIRDASAVAKVIADSQPEVVFHLAAQSLVRRSYRDPIETWSTNVMGTANVLDACRQIEAVRAVVVVGVVTELCVRATAMSAFEKGLFPIVPRECTASAEPEVAQEALESIERWYGEIVSLDELLERWRASVASGEVA